MRCMKIAGRVVRQIVKDRRTLALMFIAPVLVIFLLDVVLTSKVGKPRVLAVGLPADLQTAVSQEAEVTTASNLSEAMEQLKNRETDAVLTYSKPNVTVSVEGTQSSVTASVKKAVAAAVGKYSKDAAAKEAQEQMQAQNAEIQKQISEQLRASRKSPGTGSSKAPAFSIPKTKLSLSLTDVRYSYLCGSDDMTVFDSIAPLMMGFFIFFFVFLIAGVAFLRERISGTLERLLATPVRRYEIVFGYFLGFGVFVFLQTLVIELYMVDVLHIALKGSGLLLMAVNLLLAAGSLSLGTLLSAFARNELQLFQFIPLVIVPQILFCGLFSLRGAPEWTVILSKIFPLTYAADALQNVALRGFGFASVWQDLLILFGYMVLFLLLNTIVLKKYRRI